MEARVFDEVVLPRPEGTEIETGDPMGGDPNLVKGRDGRLCNSSLERFRGVTLGVPHSWGLASPHVVKRSWILAVVSPG